MVGGPELKEKIRKPEPTPTMEPTLIPTPLSTIKPSSSNIATPTPSEIIRPTKDPSQYGKITISPTPIPTPCQTTKPSTQSATKIKSKRMSAPTFILKKKKTPSGIRYIQIHLRKYKGKYIEIKIKKKTKYYKLKLKNASIKKNKKVFNFSYSSLKGRISFQIRTYVKKGTKKIYSKQSKVKRIRLS